MNVANRLLAEEHGVGAVRICTCGSVNLNLGTVTFHLTPEAFLKAVALLRQAATEYVEQRDASDVDSELTTRLGRHCGHYTN